MFDTLHQFGNATLGPTLWLVLWSLVKIVAVVLPLMICVAYLTLWERKGIGYTQIRLGPNRVGPGGLLQPIADAVKLIFKEIIRPTAANKGAVLPGPGDDHHAGAGGLGGGALRPRSGAGQRQRRPAVPDGHHLAGGLRRHHRRLGQQLEIRLPGCAARQRADGQLRDRDGLLPGRGADGLGDHEHDRDRHAAGQGHASPTWALGFLSWNWLPLLPIFVVFFIAGLAETNRHPFDVVEGESEIVAGHMIEYSGMSFAMFFLAEYANMILVSTLTVLLFLGGWLSPFGFLDFIPGWIWLAIKVFVVVTMFLWVRATFPRFRYDQIMRLGWKIFIPVTLVWLVVVGLWIQSPFNIWK